MENTPSSFECRHTAAAEKHRAVLEALQRVLEQHAGSAAIAELDTAVRGHLAAQQQQEIALANANLHAAELMVDLEAMNVQLHESNARLIEQRKFEQRLGVKIQTSVLPETFDIEGLEIAARMIPADDAGGDYYDAIRVDDGGWLGIGDVSGHGIDAGIIMMMVQSAVGALVRAEPAASPSRLVSLLNATLFENVRRRLKMADFVTLTLLRYFRDGRIVFAGAHEDIVIWRARSGRCESIPTPGGWCAAAADIGHQLLDTRLVLEDGDLLVLYSDGVTEARRSSATQFGLKGLCAEIDKVSVTEAPQAVVERVIQSVRAWAPTWDDDVSLLVARHRSAPGTNARDAVWPR